MLNIKKPHNFYLIEVIASLDLKNGSGSPEFKERMAWKEVTPVIRAVSGAFSKEGHCWVPEAGLGH